MQALPYQYLLFRPHNSLSCPSREPSHFFRVCGAAPPDHINQCRIQTQPLPPVSDFNPTLHRANQQLPHPPQQPHSLLINKSATGLTTPTLPLSPPSPRLTDTIALSADVDDVRSNSSSSPTPRTLSSTAGFSNLGLKLGGIPGPSRNNRTVAQASESSRCSPSWPSRGWRTASVSTMESCERIDDGKLRACHKHGQAVPQGPQSSNATSGIISEVNPPRSFAKPAPLTDPSESNRSSMTPDPPPFSFFLFSSIALRSFAYPVSAYMSS